MPSAIEFAELLGIGLFAGAVGGMLGIGGGLVMIPAMLLILGQRYGPDSIQLYKLASISVSMAVSIPAVARHHRAGAVVKRMLRPIVPMAAVGILLGVAFAASPIFSGANAAMLERLFGLYLFSVVGLNIIQQRFSRDERGWATTCPAPSRWIYLGFLVGLPTGLISGVLGVGGGTWSVPIQTTFMGVRLRYAIATSAYLIVFVSAITTIVQSAAVAQIPRLDAADGWWLALGLAPGAVLGGWLGGGLTHRIPLPALRNAFYLLLIVTGFKLLF